MNKIVAQTLIDEMQKENIRLKDEVIRIRKELSNFQRIMMQLLIRIDNSKVIHQTPLQCLLTFCQELEANLCDYSNKQTELSTLRKTLQETKRKLYETNNQLTDLLKRYENSQIQQKKVISNYSKFQHQLELQNCSLKGQNTTLKEALDEQVKLYELKQIQFDQQKRVAVAAVAHSSREEMKRYRQEVQREFNKESVSLREELKARDQMFKALAKNIQNIQSDNKHKLETLQWGKLGQIVRSVVKLEQLTQTINTLRDENAALKKEVKDMNSKKFGMEVRVNELRTEIACYQNKFIIKNTQIDQIKLKLSKVEGQLSIEKKGNKNLEKYYEEKWHSEFENVKRHLQRSHDEKILENQRELEIKKAEVTRRILSYTFMHEQDQKKIKQLDQQILGLQQQKEQLKNIIKAQKKKLSTLQTTLLEFNQMAREHELSVQYQKQRSIQQSKTKIIQLQQKIVILTNQCTSNESKISDSIAVLENKLEVEKQQIHRQHELKLAEVQVQQQTKYKQIQEQHNKLIAVYLKQNEEIKQKSQQQLRSLQQKSQKQLAQKNRELEQEKTRYKQFVVKALSNDKMYRKQIKDLREQLEEKIKEYEVELEQKKAVIRFQNEKAYKDTNLKKQMRELIDKKVAEIKDIMKEKEQLNNQLQARESQINHLTHELQQYKFTRNNWVELTEQIRCQFFEDYSKLKENYSRQISILKSKIWQLENIILKRPIRAQDQVKIRNLSEQKKNLQEKIQIKQAENGVLKQIKYYYQKKNQTIRYDTDMRRTSEINLGAVQHRKAPSILVMAKRTNRRRQVTHQRVNSQLFEENQGSDEIRMMKRYLVKNIQKEQLKMLKQQERTKYKTFYNHKVSWINDKE